MAVVGIDIGLRTTKVVLLDKNVFTWVIRDNKMQETGIAARVTLEQALREMGTELKSMERVISTGQGRELIDFASDQEADFACLAKGLGFLLPSVRTAADLGARKSIAIKCHRGQIQAMAFNNRCAAGSGFYLETIADILAVPLDATGELSLKSREELEITSTCGVFAESEVIGLIHSGKKVEDILMGIFRGVALRTKSLIMQLGPENDFALTGGLAKNKGIISAITEALGYEILVPENPQIVQALGAAVIAQEKGT